MINIIQTVIDPPGEQNLCVLAYIIIIEIEIDKPPNLNHQSHLPRSYHKIEPIIATEH
jgi:hypothetical protein